MKVCARRFNIYFALAAAIALMCGGCRTEKPDEKTVGILRIHLETVPGTTEISTAVSVLRSDPLAVTIGHDPVLTEANIIAARVIDVPGGFAFEIRFDGTGTWMLEQYSAANPGKHLVIFGQWGNKVEDGRWLAAPLISHRIGDGVLAFTPDATREEADQLVLGLNNIAKKNQKGVSK